MTRKPTADSPVPPSPEHASPAAATAIDGSPHAPRRGEAKRQAILRAAEEVFLTDGFAANLDRIAQVANVSKQTIYSHFGSKEGLFRAMGEWMKRPMAEFDDAADPVDALASFGRTSLGYATSDRSIRLNRLLMGQVEQFPDLAQLHCELGPNRTVALVARYLARLMERGVIAEGDPLVAGEDFVGLLVGNLRQRLLLGSAEQPSPEALEARARRAAELFLKAYRP